MELTEQTKAAIAALMDAALRHGGLSALEAVQHLQNVMAAGLPVKAPKKGA